MMCFLFLLFSCCCSTYESHAIPNSIAHSLHTHTSVGVLLFISISDLTHTLFLDVVGVLLPISISDLPHTLFLDID
ncbi:uncharacterized protein DS421_20g699250 [Arachis hypogaea]|nr:uncharacterized protein DS421_20g699250 [Arachis hypogaea]